MLKNYPLGQLDLDLRILKFYFQFEGAGESIIDFKWVRFYGDRFLWLRFLTSDGPLDGPHKQNPKNRNPFVFTIKLQLAIHFYFKTAPFPSFLL